MSFIDALLCHYLLQSNLFSSFIHCFFQLFFMSFSERKKNAFLKFFFLSYIIPKPKSEHSYMSKKPLKGRTQKHLHVTLTLWLISFSQSRSQLGPKSQLVQFPFSLDLTRHNSVELWLHITLIWTTWVAYKSNAFFLPFYHHLLSLSLSFFFFLVCLSCLCFILWDLMGGQPSIYNWCLYRGFAFFSFKTKHQNLSLSFALQYVFINHSPFQTQINNNTQRLYGRTQFHAIY